MWIFFYQNEVHLGPCFKNLQMFLQKDYFDHSEKKYLKYTQNGGRYLPNVTMVWNSYLTWLSTR